MSSVSPQASGSRPHKLLSIGHILGATVLVFFVLMVVRLIALNRSKYTVKGNHVSFEEIEPTLKTGDLVLCRAFDASSLRMAFTASFFSHTALIYRHPQTKTLLVIEAWGFPYQTFCIWPLKTFLQHRHYLVAFRRLSNTLPQHNLHLLDKLIHENISWGNQPSRLEAIHGVMCLVGDWVSRELLCQPQNTWPSSISADFFLGPAINQHSFPEFNHLYETDNLLLLHPASK